VKACIADTPCTPEDCPPQPLGYDSSVCIMQAGEHPCPFGAPSTFYTTLVNDSVCVCECDTSTLSCDATTTLYGALACTGAETQIPHDGNCLNVNFGPVNTMRLTASLSGNCQATDMITGNLTAEDEVTVCCVPRP
jgi:hypothetical protein